MIGIVILLENKMQRDKQSLEFILIGGAIMSSVSFAIDVKGGEIHGVDDDE